MFKKIFLVLCWAVLIIFLSSTPSLNLPESFWDIIGIDKLGHFAIYGIFTFLLLQLFVPAPLSWGKKGIILSLIIGILYGISMEAMQYTFFPGRYFEYLDIIANIIGSFTGLYFYNFYNEKS